MRHGNLSAKVWISAVLLLWGCGGQDESFYSNVLRSDIFKQQYFDSKLDFLWVLDNSPSMASQRAAIASNIQTFLTTIQSRKAVDYQMAVTITDGFLLPKLSNAGSMTGGSCGASPCPPLLTPGSNGYLIGSASVPSGVVQSTTSSNPAADFTSILTTLIPTGPQPNQGNSPDSFWEQGLAAMYLTYLNYHSVFSRNGVPLILIEVTSAEDYSCTPAALQFYYANGFAPPGCTGVEPEHDTDIDFAPVATVANYFQQAKSAEGTYAAYHAVVATASSQCNYENLGTRQIQLSQMMGNGGTVGSFCLADLPASLTNIANQINNRGTVFQLTNKADGTKPIQVYVNGVQAPPGTSWHFDQPSNSIIFDSNVPTNNSTIEVDYEGVT